MANILIHSLIFAPDGVSTAYLYSDLAIKLREYGHSITVLTTTPHFNVLDSALDKQPLTLRRGDWLYFSEYHGIPVWHVNMPKKTSDTGARMRSILKFHMRAIQFGLFSRERYDVILSPSPPLTIGAISWMLAKRMHAKPVYNVQEIYPDFAIAEGVITNKLSIAILRKVEKFVYARSARVVTISERFSRIISSRGISGNKLMTIPNFVDTDLYRPGPRDNPFAREHGLVDKFVIMYAGNIGLAQDWEAIFHAAEALKDYPVRFVIIGDGTRRSWLRDELRRRKHENILLLEYQSREKMTQINSSSDVTTILMNARVSKDGFPSKIYTTMACGKPTIAYCDEDSELASIIDDSECGEWVKTGDLDRYVETIMTYYNRRERIAAEGEKGRAFIMKYYSKDTVAKQYDQLLNELLSA